MTHGCDERKIIKVVVVCITGIIYYFVFPYLHPTLHFFVGSISLLPIILSGLFFSVWGGVVCAIVMSLVNYILFDVASLISVAALTSFWLPNIMGVVVGGFVGWFRMLYCKLESTLRKVETDKENLQELYNHLKKNERALSEAEENFRRLFAGTSDIVCYIDLEGFFREINPAFEHLTGYDLQTAQQLQYTDLIQNEYVNKTKRLHFRQYLSGANSVYNEVPVQTCKNGIVWLGYTATFIQTSEGEQGFYILARDITNMRLSVENVRKEQSVLDRNIRERTIELTKANQALQIEIRERAFIEEALRESEEKYRSLVENLRDVIFHLDPDFRISFVNSAWSDLTGYHIHDTLKQPFLKFVAVESKELVLNILQSLHEEWQEKPYCEFCIITSTNVPRWVESYFTPTYTSDGTFTGVEGILRDVTEIKKAKEALEKSHEFLDKIVSTISEPIFVKDEQHRWVLVNDAFCNLLGKEKDELIGKSDYDYLPKEQADVFWEKDNYVLSTGNTDINEEVILNSKGENRIILTIKTLFKDEAGNKFVVGIIRDITEEKEFERKIRELNADLDHRVRERTFELERSNEDLRAEIIERRRVEEQLRIFEHTFKNLKDGVFITTLQGTILFANQAIAKLYGYEQQSLIGNNIFSLRLGDGLQQIYKSVEQHETKEGCTVKLKHRTTNKREFTVSISLSVLCNGDIPQNIVAIVQDLTKDEEIESELHKLSAAVEQSPKAIVVTDLEGNIQYVNEQFCIQTGYSKTEAIGKNVRILKSGEMKPDDYAELWATIRRGEMWRGVFKNKRKNGLLYWDETIIYPLKNEQNEITHYIAFKEDITEKRKLEAQIRRSQRLEVIGTLAGGIAHDLNNVLSPILMAVQLLRMKINDPKGIQLLNTLETTVNRGADIVKQILAFARGSEGDKMLVQPKHLLREVFEIMQETFPRQIALHSEIPKDLWPIMGDATQLHQVFMNLCVNARDAMPHGGTLTLKAENIEIDEKQASVHLDAKVGPYVVISVIDTGIGIPPENIEKIFDPFFTTKEVGKGTGLGLATVQTIVKSHHGFVTVYSEVGRGSHFKVYIPAAQHAVSQTLQSIQTEPPKGRGELVLLIDDERSIREVTRELLESNNYKVLVASDGLEALSIFKQNAKNIEVVITDMMMPNMDGAAVIKEFSKLNPQTKIIAASGLVNNENSTEIKSPNVHAFLPKPYKPDKLFWVLDALLH